MSIVLPRLCISKDDELEPCYHPILYFKINPSFLDDIRIIHSPFFPMDTDWKELLVKIFNDWKRETNGFTMDTHGQVYLLSDVYKCAVKLLEKIILDCSWLNPHSGWSDQDWIGASVMHFHQLTQQPNFDFLRGRIERNLIERNHMNILRHLHVSDFQTTQIQEEWIQFKDLYRGEVVSEIAPLFYEYKIPKEYEGQVLKQPFIKEGLTMMEFEIIQNEKKRQGTFETCACDTYGLNVRTGEVFHNSKNE